MKYLHPLKRKFVSKREYFNFVLSKNFPKKPYKKKIS